jgi:digeranylgeranylglycerophospholipid reductase
MPELFDLIVVGAGPAGSAAAWTVAQEGFAVLLLEEHAQIGIPLACAEGLSRSTIKEYLDIDPSWISHGLRGSIVRGPSGEEFAIDYPNVGWILDRTKFDPALAKKAESCGAVLKRSARVIGVKDHEVIVQESGIESGYRFRFLIGADGIASKVGRWLGIDTRLGLDEIEVCAEYRIEGIGIKPGYAYLIFGDRYAPGGYAWIFPKSKDTANVGLGISPLKTRKPARWFLDRWVEQEFPRGRVRERIYGGVPARRLDRFDGRDFFLVGDAARFTDPLSGAGIANGIKSGIIAGQACVRRLKDRPDDFHKEIKKAILDELNFHLRVRNLYLRLGDREFREIFKIGRRIFEGKKIEDINTRRLVRSILLNSFRILKIGFGLLF